MGERIKMSDKKHKGFVLGVAVGIIVTMALIFFVSTPMDKDFFFVNKDIGLRIKWLHILNVKLATTASKPLRPGLIANTFYTR